MPKRSCSVINYAFDEDDDDFENFSPPVSKERKVQGKITKLSKQFQNKRLSREEKTFKRDLETAIKLSEIESTDDEVKLSFSSNSSSSAKEEILSTPNSLLDETQPYIEDFTASKNNSSLEGVVLSNDFQQPQTDISPSDNQSNILNPTVTLSEPLNNDDSLQTIHNSPDTSLEINTEDKNTLKSDLSDTSNEDISAKCVDSSTENKNEEEYSCNKNSNDTLISNSPTNETILAPVEVHRTNSCENIKEENQIKIITRVDYTKDDGSKKKNDNVVCNQDDFDVIEAPRSALKDKSKKLKDQDSDSEEFKIKPGKYSTRKKKVAVTFQFSDDSEDDFSGFTGHSESEDSDIFSPIKKTKKSKSCGKENNPSYKSAISNEDDHKVPKIILTKAKPDSHKSKKSKNKEKPKSKKKLISETNDEEALSSNKTAISINTKDNCGNSDPTMSLCTNQINLNESSPEKDNTLISPNKLDTNTDPLNIIPSKETKLKTLNNKAPNNIIDSSNKPNIINQQKNSPKLTPTNIRNSSADFKSPITLIKTPFRNPLKSERTNSPTSSGFKQSSSGHRFGLSRRANLKPLHPNASSK